MDRNKKAMELFPQLIDENTVGDVFRYLDKLRDAGIVNMYGARSYIMEEFDIGKMIAGAYLEAWMKTYDGGKRNDNNK